VGSGRKGRKTWGRAGEAGINFGGVQRFPVLSINTEVVGLVKDLFQAFLVLGFLSKSIWFCDGAGEVCRINQSLFVVNNVNFPQRSIPLIGIFFAVTID